MFGVGTLFFGMGLYSLSWGGGYALLGCVVFGVLFGVTGGQVIMRHSVDAFVYGTAGMSEKAEPSPPLLEHLQGLVKFKRYDEAEPLLVQELNNYPKSVTLLRLLAEVYMADPEKNSMARGLLRGYFELRKEVVEDDVGLLMLYADICEDTGKNSAACSMLEAELGKAHPETNLKSIRRRLDALKN